MSLQLFAGGGRAGLASTLLNYFTTASKKLPEAQPAEAWLQQLLKPKLVDNPAFNPAQLTLPTIAPMPQKIPHPLGEMLSNIPGVSAQEMRVSGLQQYLNAFPKKQRVSREELIKHAEQNQPAFDTEMYSGKEVGYDEIGDLAQQLREEASNNIDSAYHRVEVGAPRVDRKSRSVVFPMESEVDSGYEHGIGFDTIRRNQRHGETPHDTAQRLAQEHAENLQERSMEDEAEQIWQDEYYDEQAREMLGESSGSEGRSGLAQYIKYMKDADPNTYHEFVLKASHPEFEGGDVRHFGDDPDIVGHLLAKSPGDILELQSDAAQNARGVGTDLLYPTSGKAGVATLKAYLQELAEWGDLPRWITLPQGKEVAARWKQPTGPVPVKGVHIEPTTREIPAPPRGTLSGEELDSEHRYAEPAFKVTPLFDMSMYPGVHDPAKFFPQKILAPDELRGELGEHAGLLTPEIIQRGGAIDFPQPIMKNVGLQHSYDTVLPNEINAAFKPYGVRVQDEMGAKGFDVTPELRQAIEEGALGAFRRGGMVQNFVGGGTVKKAAQTLWKTIDGLGVSAGTKYSPPNKYLTNPNYNTGLELDRRTLTMPEQYRSVLNAQADEIARRKASFEAEMQRAIEADARQATARGDVLPTSEVPRWSELGDDAPLILRGE